MSGNASIGATNVSGKNGITQIKAENIEKLGFYGWQCIDNNCTPVYMGSIGFTGTRIEGAASAQRITRVTGNNDKIDIYGCTGNDCTEETLQGSISIAGSSITGTVQGSEGFLAVEASGSDIVFTKMECSYGYCQEQPAGSLTITGTTFSECPLGDYSCFYNPNIDKYQCSTLECTDATLGGLVQNSSSICAEDLNGDGDIDFSSGTSEVYECNVVEGGLYCAISAVICDRDTQEPTCPEGGVFNPDTDKCEATPDISCPSGYEYNSEFDICTQEVTCPDGGALNPNTDQCEIFITDDLCPSGYSYNPNIAACIKAVECPGHGLYNSETDRCELPTDHDCPDNYGSTYMP